MSETKPPSGSLSARLEERILQPVRTGAFARRTWFSVTVAAVVTIYAGLIGWMLWRDAADPPHGSEVKETPVEVVAEMPKPPAPPAATPEVEKPATSAPRAVNDSKDETERADKDSHAPKAAAPPAEGEPKPAEAANAAPEESKPEPDAHEAAAETPQPPAMVEKEAEAFDKAPPEPPKRPEKLAKAAPKPPRPHRAPTAAQQLAGAASLPDYTFAKPMRKHAKVSGGTEDDRYLAVVYGMITQNRRAISVPYGEWAVAVSFVVDGGGNLVGVQISRSSGYPEVDAQAVEAVEAAAPFPPPPSGGRTGLVARLRSLGSEAMAGDR